MKDQLSTLMFGTKMSDAHKQNTCVKCKQKVLAPCGTKWNRDLVYTVAGQREYAISGLCEKCFDSIFEEEE